MTDTVVLQVVSRVGQFVRRMGADVRAMCEVLGELDSSETEVPDRVFARIEVVERDLTAALGMLGEMVRLLRTRRATVGG